MSAAEDWPSRRRRPQGGEERRRRERRRQAAGPPQQRMAPTTRAIGRAAAAAPPTRRAAPRAGGSWPRRPRRGRRQPAAARCSSRSQRSGEKRAPFGRRAARCSPPRVASSCVRPGAAVSSPPVGSGGATLEPWRGTAYQATPRDTGALGKRRNRGEPRRGSPRLTRPAAGRVDTPNEQRGDEQSGARGAAGAGGTDRSHALASAPREAPCLPVAEATELGPVPAHGRLRARARSGVSAADRSLWRRLAARAGRVRRRVGATRPGDARLLHGDTVEAASVETKSTRTRTAQKAAGVSAGPAPQSSRPSANRRRAAWPWRSAALRHGKKTCAPAAAAASARAKSRPDTMSATRAATTSSPTTPRWNWRRRRSQAKWWSDATRISVRSSRDAAVTRSGAAAGRRDTGSA